jgi:adenylylsulfate kinase
MKEKGIHNVEFLDGEALRKQLDREYGYSVEERFAVARNTVVLARRINDDGSFAIVSTITGLKAMREHARKCIPHFMEVYLNCPVEICAARDFKGNYEKALAGLLENFTGVTSPYEPTDSPELTLDTASMSIQECSKILLEKTLLFFDRNSAHDPLNPSA